MLGGVNGLKPEDNSPKVALFQRIGDLAGPCWSGMFSNNQQLLGDGVSPSQADRRASLAGTMAEAQVNGDMTACVSWEAPVQESGSESRLQRVLKENLLLRAENQQLRERETRQVARPAAVDGNSEGNLRRVLADHNSTSGQLREAIASVKAMLDEASRELERMELRERRAAYQGLDEAMSKGEEKLLKDAIAVASRCGVDPDDIRAAEEKLKALLALTDEQKASKQLKELESMQKKEAFLHVKKNDGTALQELLDGLDPQIKWKDWRDHNSRTLWRFAHELKNQKVQAVLAPLIQTSKSGKEPGSSPAWSPFASPGASRAGSKDASPEAGSPSDSPRASPAVSPRQDGEGSLHSITRLHRGERSAPRKLELGSKAGAAWPPSSPRDDQREPESPNSVGGGPSTTASPKAELTPEQKLKARALRAVVADDGAALIEVIESVDIELVKTWQNKAGTDLLTLSEERGSAHAYSVLARKLGILHEMKREEFKEQDTVWVFVKGDVQAQRATVLEDTPEEADTIRLQMWDGDREEEYVERCQVRRCNM